MSGNLCRKRNVVGGLALSLLLLAGWSLHFGDQIQGQEPTTPTADTTDVPAKVSLDVAKDRARLMHDVYAATLDVMHHRYFHGDRAVVPARALEDVFAEIEEQSHIEARWIAVNLKPMSINHEPKTEFEKKAAQVIAEGEADYEAVEEGYYRRATAIPLRSGCVGCHAGFFSKPTDKPRFAGLVISVPIKDETQAPE